MVGLARRPAARKRAPGGLAEMSMVALGIGSDVAFVATHHVFRIGIIMLLAPMAFRVMAKLKSRTD